MSRVYVPGKRNIGAQQIVRRRRLGFVGLGASVSLLFVLQWSGATPLAHLTMAAPLLLTIIGFVQASSET